MELFWIGGRFLHLFANFEVLTGTEGLSIHSPTSSTPSMNPGSRLPMAVGERWYSSTKPSRSSDEPCSAG
jgi:hypothetical protein